MSTSPRSEGLPIQVHWLVRLRWAAIAAQLGSIAGVHYLFHAPFPLAPLVAIVGLLAAANVMLWRRLRHGRGLSVKAIAANLLLDIAALTALLVWTGGAMNPFTTLYLLHVALAAILVPRRWSLGIAVAAALAFGGLLLARPEAIHVWHSASMFMLHVRGMWIAFALTAACLWFFVDRVTSSLRQRDAELSRARLEAMRAERLAALGTLAAGTAHELNTPLGTVSILAAELSEMLDRDPASREHADKIRAEVRRCKAILTRMRSHEREPDPLTVVQVVPWVREAVAAWQREHRDTAVRLHVAPTAAECAIEVGADRLRQALHSLLDNARLAVREASRSAPEIEVRVEPTEDGRVALAVVDRGVGIPAEQLPRLGEPFFTTREPGQGMGLGLFLVHATLSQHGGSFAVKSEGGETRVSLVLPRARR
jgi:two-component system sensor histidine kinase RegB